MERKIGWVCRTHEDITKKYKLSEHRGQFSEKRLLYDTGWTIRGLNPGRVRRFYSYPKRPDQVWGSANLLFKGHWP